MRYYEIINETVSYPIINNDINSNSLGVTGNNANVDYRGIRVMMKPSTFLKLAKYLHGEHSDYIEDYIRNGGVIGSPFLIIRIPKQWEEGDYSMYTIVVGHEGRNRMSAIKKIFGDNPIEVHLFGEGEFRAKHFTPEIIKELQNGMESEVERIYWKGPLFSTL